MVCVIVTAEIQREVLREKQTRKKGMEQRRALLGGGHRLWAAV